MKVNHPINIICSAPHLQPFAEECANALGVTLNYIAAEACYTLEYGKNGVALQNNDKKKHGNIYVEFDSGKNAHRRKFGGGAGQLIAKACGLKGGFRPHVLDATAGLGQDGFVLANLGCTVTLLERSAIAHALLADGLARAVTNAAENEDHELTQTLNKISLKLCNSIEYLQRSDAPVADVIYLDPMFPDKQKSAAVNKNMQAFHVIIGQDTDGGELLSAALPKAKYRVVVKRPRLAPTLSDQRPTFQLEGNSSRYYIYVNQSILS